jgi:hypothetical protein
MITKNTKQNGSVIVSILIVMAFLISVIFGLLVYANSNLFRARGRIFVLQSQYAAESAADQAIAILNSGNDAYTGTASDVTLITNGNLYKATYSVSVVAGSDSKEKIVTATGKVYVPANASTPTYTRSIEVLAQRTSSTTASSMMSRNIISVDSAVKDLKARDIFVNGYIELNKNTTDLYAENITIADRKTVAASCSIAGSGNLIKPSSFSNPGQTKTKLTLAYNNCINPPGNTSNANFDVLANQTNISKIQSTFIPWSQYMDNSYQNSPSGCSDWTTGAFPRDIPSTGNTKKTHYPDSSSGISTSCGTSGNLALATGQYNIRDHVHIRANLCSSSACTPTFYNPDSGSAGIKFVFIEGSVNFDRLTTAAGSGPIVFVVYGSDPASKTGVCPLGGAAYLGNNGNTNAPQLFMLAQNGVCLDKTKFAAQPALGGVAGKNIYIATNSGTPFDLGFDVNFPVSSIPIDLSWKASRYRRL